MGTAKMLAATPQGSPVLLNRAGKGFAYLLTTWGYPGLHLQHFMSDLMRTIYNGEQDSITSKATHCSMLCMKRTAKRETCLTTVYLVNRNHYGLPEYGRVAIQGKPMLVRVEGYDMRILWNQAELVVSPFDRFVKVERVQANRDGYVVSLVAQKGTHRIQLVSLSREIDHVMLGGRPQVLVPEPESGTSFESAMDGSSS